MYLDSVRCFNSVTSSNFKKGFNGVMHARGLSTIYHRPPPPPPFYQWFLFTEEFTLRSEEISFVYKLHDH